MAKKKEEKSEDKKEKLESSEEKKEEKKEEKNENKKEGNQNILYLIIGVLVVVIAILLGYLFTSYSSSGIKSSSVNLEDIFLFATQAPLPNVTNSINYYVNNNTNIILFEFSDFDCPYCALWTIETYPILNQTYISKGLINFVYEYFPLYQIHPYANITSLYGSCIAKYYGESGFEKWYDFIFGLSNSTNITQEADFWMYWNQLGSQSAVENFIDNNLQSMGFNASLIENCVNNLQTYNEIVDLENYFVSEYGIDATPSFIIAVNTNILTNTSIETTIGILNQLKSEGLQYSLFYTPDKKYLMIEFAGALPPVIFEEILDALGASQY